MEQDLKLTTPSGIRDWPIGTAPTKRIVENKLAQLFSIWGYEEIITGTIEYEEVISHSLNEEEKGQLYRFFGKEGEALTLRPDMTTPIARFVASQLVETPTSPLRLFYTANVFRHEKTQAGRYREFYQAGIELIGTDNSRADAEVIILASEALQNLGVDGFKIGIGQVQVLDSMLNNSSLPEEMKRSLKKAIAVKDYVTLDSIIQGAGLSPKEQDLLNSLCQVQSGEEFFCRMKDVGLPQGLALEIQRLRDVFEALAAAGLEDKVFIDLGITRDFEYYTGIVFEVYTHALGFPICGGGRYNNLFSRFGNPRPATGFALGIERILLVLDRMGKLPVEKKEKLLIFGRDFRKVLLEASELRAKGYSVEIDIEGRSVTELKEYALAAGIKLHQVPSGEE